VRSTACLALLLTWALPAAAKAPSPALVDGEPGALLLGEADLPPGFRRSGSAPAPGGGAAALYLRPAALGGADTSAARLMGVKAGLRLHPGPAEARGWMRGKAALTPESIRRDVLGADAAARSPVVLHDVMPLVLGVEESEETVAFRVAYRVEPLELVEYRVRVRVANAVADLFVTGRAAEDGAEPEALLPAVMDLARVQAGRLLDALR
jgi:hypothetical protein